MSILKIIKEEKKMITVAITGEIDAQNIVEFKHDIECLAKKDKDVTIDMFNTEFIDSGGLKVLISLSDNMKLKKYSLELLNPPEHIVKLLSFAKLKSNVRFSESKQKAKKHTKYNLNEFCDDSLELTLPAKIPYIGIARLIVSGIASKYNFNLEAIEDIKTATTEILTNAILHNDTLLTEVSIVSRFDCEKYLLRIDISDEGIGFNKDILNTPPTMAADSNGLGIFIVKSIMDKVEIQTSQGKGTRVSLFMYGDTNER